MTLTTTPAVAIDVHLGPAEWTAALRADAAAGLATSPKELPPTWLYDEVGCRLFDQITELPEYYPTRAERAILEERAPEIAALARPATLVELGAGTADKTRVLIDALAATGALRSYVPFDVAEETLRETATSIALDYPGLEVRGVVGDFRRHLAHIPGSGSRLVAFLGGTLGNLRPTERAEMLDELTATLEPGDGLLIGTDVVKDRARLVAAYDDAAGVTAAFNLNVLTVLNRELGADFDPDGFEHVARFDEAGSWIEMHLRARRAARVRVPGLGLTLRFTAGETIRTEISAKFRPGQLTAELERAGLTCVRSWTDPAGDYALTLALR